MATASATAGKRRRWVSIVIAAAIVAVSLTLVVVIAAVTFFYRHVETTAVVADEATRELQQARERFARQQPLVELTAGQMTRHPTPAGPRQPVAAVPLLVYDADEGHLTRVDMPGWALRLVPSTSGLSLFEKLEATSGSGLQVTLEDIERHGPGLIVDVHLPDSQVVGWTE